jgi:hypothetical protein
MKSKHAVSFSSASPSTTTEKLSYISIAAHSIRTAEYNECKPIDADFG